jgi:hypothetical protein
MKSNDFTNKKPDIETKNETYLACRVRYTQTV